MWSYSSFPAKYPSTTQLASTNILVKKIFLYLPKAIPEMFVCLFFYNALFIDMCCPLYDLKYLIISHSDLIGVCYWTLNHQCFLFQFQVSQDSSTHLNFESIWGHEHKRNWDTERHISIHHSNYWDTLKSFILEYSWFWGGELPWWLRW